MRTRREAIVSTFLMTGIRRAELLNLRACDADLATGTIFIRSGKGRKDRTVPIYRVSSLSCAGTCPRRSRAE